MSQKKEKYIRRTARCFYKMRLEAWERAEPPRWRFIARRKWKKAKPEYEAEEKLIRSYCK